MGDSRKYREPEEAWSDFLRSHPAKDDFRNLASYIQLEDFLSSERSKDSRKQFLEGLLHTNESHVLLPDLSENEKSQFREAAIAFWCLQKLHRREQDYVQAERLRDSFAAGQWKVPLELVATTTWGPYIIEPCLWQFLDRRAARPVVNSVTGQDNSWLRSPDLLLTALEGSIRTSEQELFPGLCHLFALTIAELHASGYELPRTTISREFLESNLESPFREEFHKDTEDDAADEHQTLNAALGLARIASQRLSHFAQPQDKSAIQARYADTTARLLNHKAQGLPLADAKKVLSRALAKSDEAVVLQGTKTDSDRLVYSEYRLTRMEVEFTRRMVSSELASEMRLKERANELTETQEDQGRKLTEHVDEEVNKSKRDFIQMLGLLTAILALLLTSVNIAVNWSSVYQALALIAGSSVMLVWCTFAWMLAFGDAPRRWRISLGAVMLLLGALAVIALLWLNPDGVVPVPTSPASG